MNEQQFRIEAEAEGYTIGDFVQKEAGLANDFHSHDFAAKLLIVEGEFTVTVKDGPKTVCRANDVFQLDAGIPHKEEAGPNGARILPSRK